MATVQVLTRPDFELRYSVLVISVPASPVLQCFRALLLMSATRHTPEVIEAPAQAYTSPSSSHGYVLDASRDGVMSSVPVSSDNECQKSIRVNVLSDVLNDVISLKECSFAEHGRWRGILDTYWTLFHDEAPRGSYLWYQYKYAELILHRMHCACVVRAIEVVDEELAMEKLFNEHKAFASARWPGWRNEVPSNASSDDEETEEPTVVHRTAKEKFADKNARRKERRQQRRTANDEEDHWIHICSQSGGSATTVEDPAEQQKSSTRRKERRRAEKKAAQEKKEAEASLKGPGRARREAYQRELAKLKKKQELAAEYCRDKSKRTTKRRKLERRVKQELQQQSGIMEYVTFPYRFVKAVASLPSAIIGVTELAKTTVTQVNDPDSDLQKIIGGAAASVIKLSFVAEQASHKIEDIAEAAASTIDKIDLAIDNVNVASASVPEAAAAAKSTFDSITEIVVKLKETLLEKIPAYLVNSLMAGFLYYVLVQVQSPLLRAMIAGMTALLFSERTRTLLDEVFKGVLEVGKRAVGIGTDGPEIEQQSGANMFPLLAKTIGSVLIGTFIAKKATGTKNLETHMVNGIGSVPRVYKGIECIMETVVEMAEKGINMVRAYVELPPIKFSMKLGDELAKLSKDVYEFEFLSDNKTTNMRPVVQHTHIMALMHRVNTQLEIHNCNRELRDMLKGLKSILMRLVQPVKHAAGKDIGYRVQPASVIIAGRPGIGKTLMTQTIALAIMKLCGAIAEGASAAEASQAVFVKPYNSSYMDGYHGQFAYLIDDLFAIKPNPNAEANSFADIMTYYGSYTAMLNMADCESKGMYPFTSRLLLMTTNCRNLHSACASEILLDESAFRRRIDFHVELVVKKEYRLPFSHMLDPAKLAAEMRACSGCGTLDAFPWHIWEYFDTQFDGLENPPDEGGKPLKELLILVADKIKVNEEYHTNAMEMLDKIINAKIDDSWLVQQSGEDSTVKIVNSSSDFMARGDTAGLLTCLLEVGRPLDPDAMDEGPYIQKEFPSEWPDDVFELEAIVWLGEKHRLDPDNFVHYQRYVADAREFRAQLATAGFGSQAEPTFQKKVFATVDDMKQHLAQFTDKLYGAVRNAYGICPEYVKKIAIAATLAFAAFSAVSVVTWIIKTMASTYEWLRDMIFGLPIAIEPQSNGPKPRARTLKFVRQQSGGEVFGAWYNVYKNTYKMSINHGDGTFKVLGQILFLKQNLAVMPSHFFDDITESMSSARSNPSTMLELRSCSSKATYKVLTSIKDCLSYPKYICKDRDLVFMDFKGALRPHKDIVKFILKSSEIDDIGGNTVRLDTARMDKGGVLIDFNERVTYISPSVEVGRVVTRIGDTYHRRWLRHAADTLPGDCGAVLSLTDTTAFSCRFVVGLHVGFDPVWKRAYSTPLDAEICLLAAEKLQIGEYTEGVEAQSGWTTYGALSEPTEELPFTDAESEGFGSFEPLITISPGAPLPVASALRPTAFKHMEFFKDQIASFYDGVEPEKLTVMKLGSYRNEDGEIVFPMVKALEPYASDVRIIDQLKWRTAMEVLLYPFNKASKDFCARTLTFEEAVVGCPAFGLKSIERKSSVGYPCCLETGNRDKSYYFGKDVEFDVTGEKAQELKNDIECLLALLKNGIRPYFICRDFLKDEVRKVGKNARLIAGTDIRYYILCRMYFGAWVAAMTALHTTTGFCLGMNQYQEWDWLRQHVFKHGDNVWDGDFAGFDSSIQPSMLWPILESINEWYSERGCGDDNGIRRLLFFDLAHSRHLCTKNTNATSVVQWNKSLPSGHFLTAVCDTVVSGTGIVSGYIATTGRLDFWTNATVAALGDDNLCGVKQEFVDQFNQVSLAKHLMTEYGMVYTAGRKGEALQKTVPKEKVVFLQRRFAEKYGHTVCPIRPESFLNSLYYTRKGSELYKKSVLVDGLENALQELSLHTEEMWSAVAPRISEGLAMLDEVPKHSIVTSRSYFEIVRNRIPEYI